MLHKMKLQNNPYNSILYGNKDIEMRLYDEKRRLINKGDKICFTNIDTGESFVADVICLHRFNNFEEIYSCFDKERLGYSKVDIANYKDMEQYYSKEDIVKYGVVGIEIRVNK